jgi:hypothetical protein
MPISIFQLRPTTGSTNRSSSAVRGRRKIEVGPIRRLQDVCRVERRPAAPVHLGRLLPLGQSPG